MVELLIEDETGTGETCEMPEDLREKFLRAGLER
jgi:hypothetical protein